MLMNKLITLLLSTNIAYKCLILMSYLVPKTYSTSDAFSDDLIKRLITYLRHNEQQINYIAAP